MPLTSYSYCPYCTSGIELSRRRGLFVCPACRCEFHHNLRKWFVGIPLVIVFAVILWRVLRLPGFPTAFLATVAATIIISRMPTYIIVSAGTEPPPSERGEIPTPRKESRWFLVMLISLVAVILGILVYSIWSSL